jgi:hypothetical protein
MLPRKDCAIDPQDSATRAAMIYFVTQPDLPAKELGPMLL